MDALHQLKLLDTPPSESFDRITRMASQIFGLPIAAVSLTDQDRQWFKSRVGVDHWSIPRDRAPCAAVAESAVPLVVDDLLADPCYAESVLARAGTRFYAGAPLITREGHGLGALCVLGTEPRQASAAEMMALVDLAAMVMAQIELQHAFGRIDPISGLPTRNQFLDDLSDLARDNPGEQRFAIVVDFARGEQISRIARALGGGRVEELIRDAARALRAELGTGRETYHVGPAQFAFLSPRCPDSDPDLRSLQASLERLRATSASRFATNAALGVRPFKLGEVPGEDVLRGAASAAHEAREMANGIAVYSPAKDEAHRRQYGLLRDFSAALEAADQLRMVYQPRIDLATGRCVGAEALLRWRHPLLGDVSPGEFIPVIEQTSLARAATQRVLDIALDQLAEWHRAGLALNLSLNLSAANLTENDLVQRVQLGLLKRNLPAERLELELTESAMMEQPEQALGILNALAGAGVSLAIDDFGTGHSSLAYLQRLPVKIVKIDQAFVKNLTAGASPDHVLVESMVSLSHRLGFRVVAEGIETAEAAIALRQIGCQEGQGYLYGRPMSADAFGAWLTSSHPRASAAA
nr:GGDEF and EAL domain-containing protein [Sphingomonas quercus]